MDLVLIKSQKYTVLCPKTNGYSEMLHFYALLDIDVDVVDVGIAVPKEVLNFIYTIIGKVFLSSDVHTETLIVDIKKVADMSEFVSKYRPPKHQTVDFDENYMDTVNSSTTRSYIVFNKLYNKCIVVSSKDLTYGLDEIMNNYGEFSCVVQTKKIASASDEVQKAFMSCFQNRSIPDNGVVKEKFMWFTKLYDL